MSSITFRRAAPDDLMALVALLADDPIGSGRESAGTDPCYAAAFSAIDDDPNQLLAVAERAGRVIGVLQLSFIPGLTRRGMWRGQIEGVRVAAGAPRRRRPSDVRMGDRGMPQTRLRDGPAYLGQAPHRRARFL